MAKQRRDSQAAKGKSKGMWAHFLQRPQGAPRGLLHFYMLHRISLGPTFGYEISQDIEEKTEGAWRPAPGSIYPMMKKLVDEGLIRASSKSRDSESSQRIYEITPEGLKCLADGRKMFVSAGQKWSSMRRIFMDLMDPDQISKFLVEGSKLQFEMSQELIDSKISKLSPSDAEYTLREYALNLERQLTWTRNRLETFEKKVPTLNTVKQTQQL
jgi:DNA-binding PadR family transcriptional regulator